MLMILGNTNTRKVAVHITIMRMLSFVNFFFILLCFDVTKIREFSFPVPAGKHVYKKAVTVLRLRKVPTGFHDRLILVHPEHRTAKRKADLFRDPLSVERQFSAIPFFA